MPREKGFRGGCEKPSGRLPGKLPKKEPGGIFPIVVRRWSAGSASPDKILESRLVAAEFEAGLGEVGNRPHKNTRTSGAESTPAVIRIESQNRKSEKSGFLDGHAERLDR